MVDGLLLIDKAAGPTSHDVVNSVRRALGQKRVGHAGTLDPAATGLLILLLGKATRLAPWLQAAGKVYEGTIRVGRATATGDGQGEITGESPGDIDEERIKTAARSLIGEIAQVPPAYSAVKVNGKPSYAAARKGGQVELKARRVVIDEFRVDKIESGDYPLISFRVSCSSGTYIRALAVDLGAKLSRPAHLASLRRLEAGKFSISQSLRVQDFSDLTEAQRRRHILPMREGLEALEVFPRIEQLTAIRDGVAFEAPADGSSPLESGDSGEMIVKIVDPRSGELFGLGKLLNFVMDSREAVVKPFLVLTSG